MKYFVYDQIENGDAFDEELKVKDEAEAIREADRIWSSLSNYDQKRRSEFILVSAEPDEDGLLDLDFADVIKTYK